MSFFEALYQGAPEGLLVEVAYGLPPNRREYLTLDSLPEKAWSEGKHCFYSPALRGTKGSTKEDTAGTGVLWVDRDSAEFARATLPPSFVIWSGHGWHLYWLLDEWATDRDAIEQANKILIEDVDGDKACWNINRLLRVPGTDNKGTLCEVRRSTETIRFQLSDVQVLSRLNKTLRHKIRTGDRRGHKSRSERDWSVVQELAKAGADDRLIELLFKHQPVGDKVQDEATHATYLPRTLKRARQSPKVTAVLGGFEERENGYYVHRGKSVKRVSTFIFNPELLLDGGAHGTLDAFEGTLQTEGHTWKEVTFTRQAFSSVRSMDKETPLMGWQWLGRDDDVRNLLPYLMDKLKAKGLPRTAATGMLGLHEHGGRYLFVGTEGTLSSDDYWAGTKAPLVYLDTRREHASLHLDSADQEPDVLKSVRELLPALNAAETIWPIIGWYCAAPFKPVFEGSGYRFPILNVFGTKGSGKTTTIQRVMLPLLGQKEPKSYDANTTRFVILSLLGSSNAVPVAFSEFRFGGADKFLRYILLSYDTGHDPRGRADQTTVDYPLSAPFSVDGEDLVADPAAKERILAVCMHPAAVEEGSDGWQVNRELQDLDLQPFGAYYHRYVLLSLASSRFNDTLKQARKEVHEAFPGTLPDRVRNNLVVTYAGILSFCNATTLEPPGAEVLEESLSYVYSTAYGRSDVAVDAMVEALVNTASQNRGTFAWDYDGPTNTFYFQFSTAYSWWVKTIRGDTLGRDALRGQLREVPYSGKPSKRTTRIMYPIDLTKAVAAGLDLPDKLHPNILEVKF